MTLMAGMVLNVGTDMHNIVFIPLRRTLGGFHFNDKKKCFFASILLGVITAFGSKYVSRFSFTTLSILFIFFISLSICSGCIDHPNKPLSYNERKHYLKKGIVYEIILFIIALLLFYNNYHSLTFINVFSVGFCTLGNYVVKHGHLNSK